MAISHNRIASHVQALYVGPSTATGGVFLNPVGTRVAEDQNSGNLIKQLYRVQSANYNWGVNRVNVNQFGELAAIDRVILETPTVGLTFSYLLANMYNESGLGFHTAGLYNAVSGFLDKSQEDRNFWIKVAPEGDDAVGSTASNIDTFTYGFGNGFVTSYSTQGSVGGFPTVDIGVECLNLAFDTGISGTIPAIVPVNGARMTGYRYTLPTASGSPGTGYLDVSVLRPGDITLDFRQREAEDEGTISTATAAYSTAGASIADAHIQSYNISFNLARETMQRLGSRFAFSREITFPVDVNISVDAIVTQITTGSLDDLIDCDQSYDITVNLKAPACPGEAQPVVARYAVKNAKLDSQSYSSDIGSNQRVSLSWTAQVGSARQTNNGIFMSGISFHTVT